MLAKMLGSGDESKADLLAGNSAQRADDLRFPTGGSRGTGGYAAHLIAAPLETIARLSFAAPLGPATGIDSVLSGIGWIG